MSSERRYDHVESYVPLCVDEPNMCCTSMGIAVVFADIHCDLRLDHGIIRSPPLYEYETCFMLQEWMITPKKYYDFVSVLPPNQ